MAGRQASRASINRRGGHTSGDKPYDQLPKVGGRPAVGAETESATATKPPHSGKAQ